MSLPRTFQTFGLIATVLLLLMLSPIAAWASTAECPSYVPPEEKDDPNQLALRGVACFEAGNYIQALILYRQAYEISKSAPLRGAIGRTLQELGLPELAREYFMAYLKVQTTDTEGYQKIRQRLSVVEKTLKDQATPTTITTNPGGATVFAVLEGEYWEELGTTPLKVRLLPGEYRLVFRRADFITREETVTVPDSDAHTIDTRLVPQDSLFDTTGAEWRRRGIYTMVASVPFLAAGGTLFVLSNRRFDEADAYAPGDPSFDRQRRESLNDEAYSLQTWGIITSAAGGTILVTGLAFYLVGLNDGAEDTSSASFWFTPRGAGVRLTW